MTIEQKAKRYDEALERAKKEWLDNLDGAYTNYRERLEIIFPELKESEDERIRKELLEHCKNQAKPYIQTGNKCPQIQSWIAWLEKQGEIGKVSYETAEKEKEDCVNNETNAPTEYGKYVDKCLNEASKHFFSEGEDKYSVADLFYAGVKCGKAWLEKQGEQTPKHFELKAGHWYICHRAFCCRADHLTVKEGERFMCEKDGVVKGFVVKEPEKYFKEVCAPAPMGDEEKPDWSEEDEKIRKAISIYLDWLDGRKDCAPRGGYSIRDMVVWLEKQKQKPNYCHHKVDLSGCSEEYRKAYYDGWNNCNMQHSQCLSEGNDVVKCLINGMKFYYKGNEEATWGTEKFSMKVKDILNWLEKQGEQKSAEKKELKKIEQKPAWSEEDEKMFDEVINNLHNYIFKSDNTYFYIDCDKHITWLKSFKDRVQPQPKQD